MKRLANVLMLLAVALCLATPAFAAGVTSISSLEEAVGCLSMAAVLVVFVFFIQRFIKK